MKMKRSKDLFRLAGLTLGALIAACSPSKEDVADAVRGALVEMLATTPETRGLDLHVGRITLVTVEANKVYDGMALITRGKESRDVPIHVITDGEHVLVTPDANVLGLLMVSEADAELNREMEQAVADMETASAEIDSAMSVLGSHEGSERGATSSEAVLTEDLSLSGRFISDSGNGMLILPRRDGRSPAVLQLGVGTNPHCIEGDVSCVSLDGVIFHKPGGALWVSESSSSCEVSVRLHEDSVELLPLAAPCEGFGTANAHLAAGIAGNYRLDSSAGHMPSFECAKATTAVERMICTSPVLGFLDHAMGVGYKQHQAASGDKSAARREQLAWVAERDACKDDTCVMQSYLDRLYRLQ
jgi:uncharacterized protein YecT (DUF1311 family)